jgi:sialate O-acetylesterase
MERMKNRITLGLVLAATLVMSYSARANVELGRLFVDGAVLQSGMRVPIWGFAGDGEKVVVSIRGQTVSAVAVDGKWLVWLKPMKPGGPFTLEVTGKNSLVRNDIMVGEVWLCSGQSNMDFPLSMTENGKEVAARSADPLLRQFKVPMASPDAPAREIDSRMQTPVGVAGKWQSCAADTSGEFSAVAYYFGRELKKRLNVPVGLLNSSIGGTMAQEWTSRDALLGNAGLRHLAEEPQPDSGGPYKGKPCGLYNGMIAPLVPYAVRGVIWYQGESDAGVAYQYRTLLPALISDWRHAWNQDFPFLIVQIAPMSKIHPPPHESAQAELREAQALTSQSVPKTALVVITDYGDENSVHPTRKEPVGVRLSLAARAIAYRERLEYSGPVYKGIAFKDNSAVLSFTHAKGGLVARGEKLTGFTIAGEDHAFHPAEAEIKGNTVRVWSQEVTHPIAVRMGWAGYPVVNLYNKAGYPPRRSVPTISL